MWRAWIWPRKNRCRRMEACMWNPTLPRPRRWSAVAGLAGITITAHLALAQAPPAVTVSAPLQKEITEWDEFTGQFAAVDYVEIRARDSAYPTEIHFQD